jgi:basic amino acid/polyamine antiporter, APA family
MAEASGRMAVGSGLYLRKATGLVREVNRWDAVVLNLFFINIPLGVLLITQAPNIWPGVDMVFGMLLTTVILIPPILMYAFMAAAMPRAGGDYVYVSRIIHPAAGFIFNLALTIIGILFAAVFAAWMSVVGLSPSLATLGTVLNNGALTSLGAQLATQPWEFGIGLASILLCGVLNLYGWRVVIPTMRVMIVIVLAALLVVIALMVGTDSKGFAGIFAKYGSYSGVISAAQQHGFQVGASSDPGKILGFIALGFTVLGLSTLPAYTAGEVKTPSRSLVVAMIGGLLVAGALVAIMSGLAYRTFGPDFLGGMTFLSNNDPKDYPKLPPPFFFLYASMLTNNILVLLLISVGFIVAIFAGMFTTWLQATRNFLAYSLDRVLPDWFAEVSPRFHTPTRINMLVTAISVLILTVYVFGPTSLFGFVYSAALLQAIVFSVTAISAILFAYRAPDLFEASPYPHRILGIPVITILGVVSLVEYIYFAYVLATNAGIGANVASGLISIAVIFLIPIPIYVISYLLQRRRGVNIALAFKELPPE